MTLNRTMARWAIAALLVSGTSQAVESPPPASPFQIQTNSANAPIGNGDWYSSQANGVGGGFHYFSIHVPSAWPSTEPVYIDLRSPELNTNDPLDEPNSGGFGNSQFELYTAGTAVVSPATPGPGAAGSLGAVTYTPSSQPVQWRRTFTLPAPVAPGRYILRAQSAATADDQNGYRIRVGTDNDTNPNNAPPANADNPDGLPGTGDEVILGTFQVTYQQDTGGTQCLTLYEYVSAGLTTLTFNNFDMDNNNRVCYYSPSDNYNAQATGCGSSANSGTPGTLSGNTLWNSPPNNNQPPVRGGDTIVNPETGWWAIVSCIGSNNQFIQEGPLNTPAFDFLPPVPILELTKDDNVDEAGLGEVIDYTIAFTNTSDMASTAPSAASNIVITDTIPVGMSYVGCAIDAPLTGMCSESGGTVTYSIDQTVVAGGSGSVTLSLRVESNVVYPILNTARVDYQDPWFIGSFFDTASESTPEKIGLTVGKSANPTIGSVGDNVSYDYVISNTAGSYIELSSVIDDKIGPLPFTENQGMATLRYDFTADASPNTVEDTSGVPTLMNLTAQNPTRITYPSPPGTYLSINNATRLQDTTNNSKVFTQCTASNEITVEAWVRTGAATQGGPARIVTQSLDANNRNFTLAQNGSAYQFRLRTTTNGNNGTNVILESAQSSTNTTVDQHIVFTRGSDTVSTNAFLYLNGVQVDSDTVGGDFSNWNANYDFGIGNEFTDASTSTTRDWQGRIYEVSVYCNALTPEQVGARFAYGSERNVDNRTILAPGESLNLTAVYQIMAGDFPGPVVNVVQVTGTDQNGDVFFDQDTASVDINPSDLELTKTSNVMGSADPGDIISYEITLTNNSGTTQTGIVINDGLPVGLTYVPESTVAQGVGGVVSETYADDFANPPQSYARNVGSLTFTTSWDESGAGDAGDSPSAGSTFITGNSRLQMRPGGNAGTISNIQRSFSLNGASSATLSFDWFVNGNTEPCNGGFAQDCARVFIDVGPVDFSDTDLSDGTGRLIEISDNNIGFDPANSCTDNGASGSCSIVLDSQIFGAADVFVGFQAQGLFGGGENVQFDNVQISYTTQTPLILDNDPNTGIPALDDGDVPFLVTASDGFVLGPGQSMTVTFDAQVDPDLDPAVTILRNFADADSDQTFPVVAERLDQVSPRGSIGDLVWFDADMDGFFDVGEAGLANITVTLRDAMTNAVVATTTTAANGTYLFDRLIPGDYRVEIDIPPDLMLSAGQSNPSADVSITGAENVRDVDFGLTATGVIGDSVFSDADGDGVQDPNELGIGGVTVELRDASTGAVVATTTTAADGSYRFTGVPEGSYRVFVTDTGGVLDNYTVTTGAEQTPPIALEAGGVYLAADFGYQNMALADIRDKVWFDANNNGLLDGNEEGIANVSVDLLDSMGQVVATAITNSFGNLEFRDVPDGDYTLRVADNFGVLTGFDATTPPAVAQTLAVTLMGSDVNGTSFGYSRPGFVGDTVFSDADGDGIQDMGEAGIPGVQVLVYRDSDGDGVLNTAVDELVGSTTTDAAGKYGIVAPRFGTYFASIDNGQAALSGYTSTTVDEQPGGSAPGTQIVAVLGASNGGFLDADFGYQNAGLADVSGNVFNDVDRDGIDDGAGEPGIGQVTVELVSAGPDGIFGTFDDLTVASQVTQANGDYRFTDVPPGDYRVRITDDNEVLTDFTITSGLDSLPITVAMTDIEDVDFGYARTPTAASIGDFVWLDADNDGFPDASEPGLPGVEVSLFNVGPDGMVGGGDDVLISVTTTDARGGYRFTDLDAGDYYVSVDSGTLPSNLTQTGGANPTAVIALARGQAFDDADFGFGPAANTVILGDFVWSDTNGNGQPDPGEAGIPGVTIDLFSPGPDGQAGTGDDISASVVTDVNGRYLFTGLAPDILYNVTLDDATIPPAFDPDPTNTGGAGFYTYDVTPSADQAILSLDYGFQPLPGQTASIGDLVFLDVDGDGSVDPGEPGIEGVSLNLVDPGGDGVVGTSDDVIVATTFTNASGGYDFTGLPAGDYAVVVTDTRGVLQGLNISTPLPPIVSLSAGDDIDTIDFGYAPSAGIGSIGNSVFHDRNSDGDRDAGESGIEGVQVALWEDINGNGIIEPGIDNRLRTTRTDENGNYTFTGLPDGDYLVELTAANFAAGQVLEGTASTAGANPPPTDNVAQVSPLAITLGGGTTQVQYADFGIDSGIDRTLSGTTFEDTNDAAMDRGTLDPGEPDVAGVTLILYRDLDGDGVVDAGDPVWGRTVSAADGSYQFDSLPPGNYIVVADAVDTRVNGFQQTTQQSGVPQVGVQPVDLQSGDSTGNDFGFYNGGVTTTPVSLAYFRATNDGQRVTFEWGTATESGNAGFRIVGEAADGRRYDIITFHPSQAVDSLEPLDYVARSLTLADRYWIADIDLFGAETFHGPFVADGRMAGARIIPEPVDWRGIDLLNRQTPIRAPSSAEAVALKTTKAGVYRVSHSDLLAAGLSLEGVPASSIALIDASGQPVPRRIDDALFGAGSTVEFVAEAIDTLYTGTNVYRLLVDPVRAMEIATDADVFAVYDDNAFEAATMHVERQDAYSFSARSSDPWYDERLLAFENSPGVSYSLELPTPKLADTDGVLSVRMEGGADFPAAGPDHHVIVEFNGVVVADLHADGLVPIAPLLDIDLQAGLNDLTVRVPGDTGNRFDLVNFDSASLTYSRMLDAGNDQYIFAAVSAPAPELLPTGDRLFGTGFEDSATRRGFRVHGVADAAVTVYAIAGSSVVEVPVSVESSRGGYDVLVPARVMADRYVVATTSQVYAPVVEGLGPDPELLKGAFDYIMVAHPLFVEALQPLADFHTGQGRAVQIVSITDVYRTYSGGVVDPTALSAFLADAHTIAGANHALLVGADSYDYRDYLGIGSISYIPTLYVATDEIVQFTPSDSALVDFDGDNVPDMPIGRLPARTVAELSAMVGKTIAYAQSGVGETALFAADRNVPGSAFTAMSEDLIERFDPAWSLDRAYLDELQTPAAARSAIINAVNRGTSLITWFGHSAPTRWSFENVLSPTDVASMNIGGFPTVFNQWGCWNTYFVSPTSNTLAHALIAADGRGAAAVMGPSTLASQSSEQVLGNLAMPMLTDPTRTIGEVMVEARRQMAETHPDRLDVLLGHTLLGDPALQVAPD